MEAVGAGASVLAFITLALQSAKIISNTLSGIQDAPENVGHAASAVGSLQAALGQLSQCPLVSQGQSSRDGLHDQVKRCYQDLAGFASKLDNIQITATESRSRKLWKRVRTFIDEKEIDKMVRVVTAHSSTLSLWLQSIQSTTVFDSRIQISALSQTISASAQDTQTRMNEELQAISTKLENSRTESTEAHQDLDTKLSLILHAIESLKLATGTAGQDDRTVNVESTRHSSSPVPIDPIDEKNQKDAKLVKCIHRLQVLVDQERRVLDMEEVDRIIEDLQSVIFAVQNTAKDSSGKRLLKRISAVLGSAQMVSLNEKGTVVNRPTGRILQQQHVLKEFKDASGRISIKTKTRRVRQHINSYDDEEFVGSLIFLPPKGAGRSMFTATVQQKATWTGCFTSIPHLQVNRVLPAFSPVFQHIRRGRLDRLLEMLRSGQASLRDHDEYGNSLLAIAASCFVPQICNFLLAHNADVDVHFEDRFKYSFHILRCPNYGQSTPASRTKCLRLILEAGGDPTDDSSTGINRVPFFASFDGYARHADLETMRVFLDHSLDWGLSIHSRDENGRTPFLIACETCAADNLETVLPLLFERGANVTDVDSGGRGCLHLFLGRIPGFSRMKRFDLFERADRDAAVLISLIKRGADVLAKDKLGRSVSHVETVSSIYNALGISYQRDLWDFVLTVCGYNVFEVRGHHPRIARYKVFGTSLPIDYTPEVFRHLWKGREHLCPYPEDLTDEVVDISQVATTFAQEQAANRAKPNHSVEAQRFWPTYKRCGNWDYCRDPNCGFCEEERCGLCRNRDYWDQIPVSSEPSVIPSIWSGQSLDGSGEDESSDGEVASCQSVSQADTQCPSSWNSSYETDNAGEDGSWTKTPTHTSHDSTHPFPAIELENPWADVM